MGLPSLRFRNDDRFFRVVCEPTAEPAIALLLMLHVKKMRSRRFGFAWGDRRYQCETGKVLLELLFTPPPGCLANVFPIVYKNVAIATLNRHNRR